LPDVVRIEQSQGMHLGPERGTRWVDFTAMVCGLPRQSIQAEAAPGGGRHLRRRCRSRSKSRAACTWARPPPARSAAQERSAAI